MTYKVLKLDETPTSAKDVCAHFDKYNIDWTPIDNVNWPQQYPYKPEVKFRIAYTDSALILNYEVFERSVAAVAPTDNGNVWEDSCVEFFLQAEEGGEYYNVECNCVGTLLIAHGMDRNSRTPLAPDVLKRVKRYSTLGTDNFEERKLKEPWRISLIIPLDLLGIERLDGSKLRCNFYKCGDNLSVPHFLSWAPIETESPDFHRPDFFKPIEF